MTKISNNIYCKQIEELFPSSTAYAYPKDFLRCGPVSKNTTFVFEGARKQAEKLSRDDKIQFWGEFFEALRGQKISDKDGVFTVPKNIDKYSTVW